MNERAQKGREQTFSMLELAMMLTPTVGQSEVARLIAAIAPGDDRCKEYLAFQPIQFFPAYRLRIVEPVFCYCPHAGLAPWIPMLSLACHYDPEGANVLLDSTVAWWIKAVELPNEFLSPLMRYFGKRFLEALADQGFLDDSEMKALLALRANTWFWNFDGALVERTEG